MLNMTICPYCGKEINKVSAENRKIWKTGRGTYVISLPSEWAEKFINKYGDQVKVSFFEEKAIISPLKFTEKNARVKITPPNILEKLESTIISYYTTGSGQIIVDLEDGNLSAIDKILTIKDKLEGTSILRMSPKEFVISFSESIKNFKDLLDVSFSYYGELFEENTHVIKNFPIDETAELESIQQKMKRVEDETDTITFVIKRLLSKSLVSPEYKETIGLLDLRNALHFNTIASGIERLCDLEVELFNEVKKLNAKCLKNKVKIKLADPSKDNDIYRYHQAAYTLNSLAYKGFEDPESAYKVLRTKKNTAIIDDEEIEYRGEIIKPRERKALLEFAANYPQYARELTIIEQKIWGMTGVATNIAEAIMNLRK